jgi:transcription elongation factor GreA
MALLFFCLSIFLKMTKINYYTEAGLKKLRDQLQDMERVQRPIISAQIGEAIDKGDLSENAEYDAAKEAQGLLEMKIAKLQTVIMGARLIDETNIDTTRALILSNVRIKNLSNNSEVTYTLVAENESDLKEKKISVDSPIGKGLLGKSLGDVANIETPRGVIQFEILEITRS